MVNLRFVRGERNWSALRISTIVIVESDWLIRGDSCVRLVGQSALQARVQLRMRFRVSPKLGEALELLRLTS